jgi:hypothetical protein
MNITAHKIRPILWTLFVDPKEAVFHPPFLTCWPLRVFILKILVPSVLNDLPRNLTSRFLSLELFPPTLGTLLSYFTLFYLNDLSYFTRRKKKIQMWTFTERASFLVIRSKDLPDCGSTLVYDEVSHFQGKLRKVK